MGFGQGLSGLNAAAQELDVIGNNIANAGTVGFKSSSVTFSDVYANSQVGLGVKVAAVNQRFTVGSISNTGNSLDMAIDGEKGLFRTEDTNGNVLYTRNGQFFADKNNFIVNAQGQRLTGYGLVGDDVQALTVPVGNIAPQPTADITTSATMDANAPPVYEADSPEVLGSVWIDTGAGGTYEEYEYRVGSTGQMTWFSPPGSGTQVSIPDGTYSAADHNAGTDATPITLDTTTGQTVVPSNVLGENADVGVAYEAPIIGHPFSLTDPESYTHTLPLTVYDSVGNSHQMIQYFVKRPGGGGDSPWDVYYALDGNVVNEATPHEITYDTAGRLSTGTLANLTIPNPGGANTPTDPLELTFDYTGSTQYGGV
ncbi:MAG TPA: flagellar hook protein FlgE, partial [Pusillimonas sp.]|nr:flagellar hook protein FlgE [Pusillimonas sp.]